jgi:hypothetical protein
MGGADEGIERTNKRRKYPLVSLSVGLAKLVVEFLRPGHHDTSHVSMVTRAPLADLTRLLFSAASRVSNTCMITPSRITM